MGEIRSHTSLRGIAALLVVIYHFYPQLQPVIEIDRYTLAFSRGHLWVDFFFILSGYILCYVYSDEPGTSRKQALSFLWARFARVFPLHIATLLFLVVFQLASSLLTSGGSRIGEFDTFWLNILNIHAWGFLDQFDWNFPSWSISAEFAAYLSFPIICFGLLRAPKITFSVMAIAIVFRFTYQLVGFDSIVRWERTVLLRTFPMFFLGIFLFRSRPWCQKSNCHILSGLQFLAVLGIAISLHYGWNDACIVVMFALIIIATQTDDGAISKILVARPFVFLGLWSYSIYMLHICVRYVLFLVWPKLTQFLELTPESYEVSFFIAAIILTITLGAFSFSIFETPVRLSLRKRFIRL